MEMEMQMKSYLKDNNVGAVVGVVMPNGTANHKHAAQEMNEINTIEHAIPTRYYYYRCRHLVTVDVKVEIKCPFCQEDFIQACEGINFYYLTMSSESEHFESGSDVEVCTILGLVWYCFLKKSCCENKRL
ncbi:zinc finger CCCH domain-containing protein 20-like [Pyrus ussuriensis x Pyrus communis]|uniref:Zinc finger CCCH domain-containing protein 20-like n=1 Tax=Pyrus ussuriensis x Pyrus communis TaxID=2448454 RepID=A0A5N5FQP5_9ROSA|nr:zinc finger CCCH domain-containing protein 20-like [Pyrus ussuriensis x Pyrus communis]